MTDNHNTLDDLVHVALAYVPRCEAALGCEAPATRIARDLYRCDAHGVAGDHELSTAGRIRRLAASRVLK